MANNQLLKSSKELVKRINDNFSTSGYPGDDRIGYDNSGNHLECNQISAAFKGLKWNEVPLKVLRYHHEALFFFTQAAYRYYLPAYLRAAVKYTRVGNIRGTVIFSLTPPNNEGPEMTQFRNKMKGFNPNQRKIIREFLEFTVEAHIFDYDNAPPKVALDRFWKNYK